jgi:hypothetical protein
MALRKYNNKMKKRSIIQKLINDGYMYEVRPGIFEGIIDNKKFKFEIINKRFEDQEE